MGEEHTFVLSVKNNILVCVTGKVGSGKSTALKLISKQGFNTFCMDEYIHSIYKRNNIGYRLIKDNFGEEYVTKTQVNRTKLGKLVFSNKKQLDKLNNLMIPLMQHKINEIALKKQTYFIELGIYFWYEKKFEKFFSKVIYIRDKKNDENKIFLKKITYLKKIPTFLVGKSSFERKNTKNQHFFIVENDKNLTNFKNNLLNILKKI